MAVLPRSGFVQTVHCGKRTKEEATCFLQKVKGRSDGQAPLFLSDAWFYEDALYNTYCRYEVAPYKGRGPYPPPMRVVDESLMYAQVYKERDKKGKVVAIHVRYVKGDDQEVLRIIRSTSRAKVVNTSYVESRNGKFRKDDARLIRRTLCHSKKTHNHDAHVNWLTGVFNFCRENSSLKEVVNPKAELFEQKYKSSSPAMAEGMTDKILTVKELLCWRPIQKNP